MANIQMLMRCKASSAKTGFGSMTLGICMIICTVAIVPLGETTVDFDKFGCHKDLACYTPEGKPFGKMKEEQ